MKQINNADFFKKKTAGQEPVEKAVKQEKTVKPEKTEKVIKKQPEKVVAKQARPKLKLSQDAVDVIGRFSAIFKKYSMKSTAEKIANIYKTAVRDRFSVAVVGEFSTGKSTFINNMFGRDFLPVSNLPSTALLTRIRYSAKESLVVVDEKGQKVKTLPLEKSSWRGLTANNFYGEDAKGSLFVGLEDEWLRTNNVEIIDTPGAGDLEENRVQLIGDALLGCDGAIIVTRATEALSMSEKLFIEQRLITRKTPFMMLIITKLDQIPLRERKRLVDFVTQKLKAWGMDIPVYVPYNVEMPDDTYDDIIGIDKIKEKIVEWVCDPVRAKLTEEWVMSNVLQKVQSELDSLEEQLMLRQEADENKRRDSINKKRQLVEDAKAEWENLRVRFLERANDCSRAVAEKAAEYKVTITERLQYEASHTNDLQKWWNSDYPYRLKIELANMSAGMDNVVTRRIADDARWFNNILERQFKTHVMYNDDIRVMDKNVLKDTDVQNLVFEDINKKRNIARIGTTVLSIALYPICMGASIVPIVATMGVSTGASIFSEKIFGSKIEKQREVVKSAIATNVPMIVDRSMADCESRLRKIYADMMKSALEKEKEWIEKQNEAIANSIKPMSDENIKKLTAFKNELKTALRAI